MPPARVMRMVPVRERVQGRDLSEVHDLRVGDAHEGMPVQFPLQLIEPLPQGVLPPLGLGQHPLVPGIAPQQLLLPDGEGPLPLPAGEDAAAPEPGGQGLHLIREGGRGDGSSRHRTAVRVDTDSDLHAPPPFLTSV